MIKVAKKPEPEKKKKKKKDSQLVIRINRTDRDRFLMLCEKMETSAASELRKFIKYFMKDHEKILDE